MAITLSSHKAIHVKRTARGYVARAESISMRVPYDYGAASDQRYTGACQALADREGWRFDYIGSQLQDGSWVFVPLDPA